MRKLNYVFSKLNYKNILTYHINISYQHTYYHINIFTYYHINILKKSNQIIKLAKLIKMSQKINAQKQKKYKQNIKARSKDLMSLLKQLQQLLQKSQKKKQPFIRMKRMTQNDDSLFILTQKLQLNVSYTSPILQSFQFMQQYEKYCLRQVLSSFPISIQSFEDYYNDIQNTIMLKFKKYMIKTINIVYQMLNLAYCFKIQQMRTYNQVFKSFRDNLLNRKSIDTYFFQSQQFQSDKQKIFNMLKFSQVNFNSGHFQSLFGDKQSHSGHFQSDSNRKQSNSGHKQSNSNRKQSNSGDLQSNSGGFTSSIKSNAQFQTNSKVLQKELRKNIKDEIQNLTKKINIKSKQMMDRMVDCKVQFPYMAQNVSFDCINCQKVLSSYYKSIKIKNYENEQLFENNYFQIRQTLTKVYSQDLLNYHQSNINCASKLIQTYNTSCQRLKSLNNKHLFNENQRKSYNYLNQSIQPQVFNLQKRKAIDTNQITNTNWVSRKQTRSALINKNLKLQFDNVVRFFDLEKGTDDFVQMNQTFSRKFNKTVFNPFNQQLVYSSQVNLSNLQIQNYKFQVKKLQNNEQTFKRNNFNEFNKKQYQEQIQKYNKNEKKKDSQKKILPMSRIQKQIKWCQLHFGQKNKSQYNIILYSLFCNYSNKQKQPIDDKIDAQKTQYKQSQSEQQYSHMINPMHYNGFSFNLYQNRLAFSKKYYNSTQKKSAVQKGRSLKSNLLAQSKPEQYVFSISKPKQPQIIQDKAAFDLYQNQKRQQQQRKQQSLLILRSNKTYSMFAALSINPKTKKGGLDINTYIKNDNIYRYGIEVQTNSSTYQPQSQRLVKKLDPQSIQHLNKFFFYFFKESYYRQHKQIRQNSQIPIFMSPQSQEDFLSAKVVKKIIGLIKKQNYFIIWANDIFIYDQKRQFNKKKGSLQVISFTSQLNTQRFVYELSKICKHESFKQQAQTSNKAIQKNMKQTKYLFQPNIDYTFVKNQSQYFQRDIHVKKGTILQIYSKIECVHRAIYDRHKRSISSIKRQQKGKEIYKQIIQKLIKQISSANKKIQ